MKFEKHYFKYVTIKVYETDVPWHYENKNGGAN